MDSENKNHFQKEDKQLFLVIVVVIVAISVVVSSYFI